MIKLFLNIVKNKLKTTPAFKKLNTSLESGITRLVLHKLERGLLPFLLASLWQGNRIYMIVVPTASEAQEVAADLKLILKTVYLFPGFESPFYATVSSALTVYQTRAKVLAGLLSEPVGILVTSVKGLLGYVFPKDYFKENLIKISVGQVIDPSQLALRLERLGYCRMPRVGLEAEFAVRGEVIDIFMPQAKAPVRLLLDFDRVESIRFFDPITQLTEKAPELTEIVINPIREVVFDKYSEEIFLNNLKDAGCTQALAQEIWQKMILDPERVGLDSYLPFFSRERGTILNYLNDYDLVFLLDYERIIREEENLWFELKQVYQTSNKDNDFFPKPELIFTQLKSCFNLPLRFIFCQDHALNLAEFNFPKITLQAVGPRYFFGNLAFIRQELSDLLNVGYQIFIFAGHKLQAQRLMHLFSPLKLKFIPASLSAGFSLPELKIMAIAEHELFRRKKRVARLLKKISPEKIDSFLDLEIGEYVVHLEHGIGRYLGIERVKTSQFERDYIKLEYAEGEILFMPTEQLNFIGRYLAPGGQNPQLDYLGGKGWSRRKEKVKRSVEELAQRLLKLYAERSQLKGFAFPKDTEWQEEFEAGFPYEETPDQLKAIAEVKADMEKPIPMDRLICGDVGFGKTEIAMRAAFKAVMGGKQVAILAPTTILVEQHYENFCERFASFPVTIAMLSRFVPASQQKQVIQKLANQELDIIIGTQRLLQKDIHFKNLGLLIVDEEQRFGVKHKEYLKELKTNLDCLTLSATPIPRTLYMSLMKIRDMSLLTTPPQNRLPIKTFVHEATSEVIKEAIDREIARGGQVYFLHNRIETIDEVAANLEKIFPHLQIAIIHSKLAAYEIEDIMHRFIHREYHILLSTAIIENGIDIPNVNTIIIDRADMFGIAQLYQLRGRVGRSDIPAYAYLLYPSRLSLSDQVIKRLKIISDFTELGSGFKIALKDLELRGAGNLLGKEQHGDILAVGYEIYLKLLHEAMADPEITDKEKIVDELYLELEYSGFIPESYIAEPMEKMEVYKQLSQISCEEELDQVIAQLEDRFGPLPDELQSLISICEIRIMAARLAISMLKEKNGVVQIKFSRLSKISADKVIRLVTESGGRVFLKSNEPDCIFIKTDWIGLKEKACFLKEKLSLLL